MEMEVETVFVSPHSPEVKYVAYPDFSEYEDVPEDACLFATDENVEDNEDNEEELTSFISVISHSNAAVFENESDTEINEDEDNDEGVNVDEYEEKRINLQITKFSTAAELCAALMADSSASIGKHSCNLCTRNAGSPEEVKKHLEAAHKIPKSKYTCKFCKKRFVHHWFYKHHLKTSHNAMEVIYFYSCKECGIRLNTEKELEDHKLKDHPPAVKPYPFKCHYCDVVFEKEKYIELLRLHLMEFHSDTKEGTAAKFNTDYIQQEEEQTVSLEDTFPCKFCKRKFSSDKWAYLHMLYEHRGVNSCHACRKTLYTEDMFMKHIRDTGHELTRCSFCTKNVKTLDILVEHWDDVHSEIGRHSFYCEVCCSRFVTVAKLINHYDTHINPQAPAVEKPVNVEINYQEQPAKTPGRRRPEPYNPAGKFPCAFCSAAFAFRNDMYRHLRKKHPATAKEVLPYQCDECGMLFDSFKGLKTHRYRVHARSVEYQTGELQVRDNTSGVEALPLKAREDFPCRCCTITFTRRADMYRHMRKQHPDAAKEYFHKCVECAIDFPTFRELKAHRETRHGIVPLPQGYIQLQVQIPTEQYACHICNTLCSNEQHLEMHINTRHSGTGATFVCQICEKQMSGQYELQRHMLTHTGERPHCCPMCNKGFTTAQNLRSHIMLHNGIKPYICMVCKKQFTQLSNLKAHERVHERIRILQQ